MLCLLSTYATHPWHGPVSGPSGPAKPSMSGGCRAATIPQKAAAPTRSR